MKQPSADGSSFRDYSHQLVLVTDNRRHFPMPELQVFELPIPPKLGGRAGKKRGR